MGRLLSLSGKHVPQLNRERLFVNQPEAGEVGLMKEIQAVEEGFQELWIIAESPDSQLFPNIQEPSRSNGVGMGDECAVFENTNSF